jgi:hypothetical protein
MEPAGEDKRGGAASVDGGGLMTDSVPPTASGTSSAVGGPNNPSAGAGEGEAGKALFADLLANGEGEAEGEGEGESDLLADRVVQDGGTMAVVDKDAAIKSKHRALMAAMAEEEAQALKVDEAAKAQADLKDH